MKLVPSMLIKMLDNLSAELRQTGCLLPLSTGVAGRGVVVGGADGIGLEAFQPLVFYCVTLLELRKMFPTLSPSSSSETKWERFSRG